MLTNAVTMKVNFLVVEYPSVNHTIIGCPTLHQIQAITSTYNFLIKFPTPNGIGELRGEQGLSREYYDFPPSSGHSRRFANQLRCGQNNLNTYNSRTGRKWNASWNVGARLWIFNRSYYLMRSRPEGWNLWTKGYSCREARGSISWRGGSNKEI